MPMRHGDWAIYYADGSKVTSQDMAWDDAPQDGVQVVINFSMVDGLLYALTVQSSDLYAETGLKALDYRLPKSVKRGVYTSDLDYHVIRQRAHDETMLEINTQRGRI